jgi:hypothetical protein
MREKLEDNNVYFYYKDDIKNIIKGMWQLESTIQNFWIIFCRTYSNCAGPEFTKF